MAENPEHKGLYKKSAIKNGTRQELRRQQLLKEQKLQRAKFQDQDRSSLQEYIGKISHNNNRKKVFFHKKYHLPYALQLSEWLKEKPEALDSWYLVPCPKGRRCLLVACNGVTEVYNKRNVRTFSFNSNLPGDGCLKSEFTILDVIYCENLKTFYVLDSIVFGNHELFFCEAIFRHFWIKSRFDERDYYDEECNFKFELIRWVDCEDEENLRSVLMKYPYFEEVSPELDGFLFYHKESSYTFGTTPLVGWLFPFLIPEILNFDVHPEYLKQKPVNFENALDYMDEFDRNLNIKRGNEMDANAMNVASLSMDVENHEEEIE